MLVAAFAVSLLSGCGGSSTATSSQSAQAEVVKLDPSLVLAEEPAEILSVAEVREKAKDGDEVVVAGWIAGSKQPIIEGRAAFTIVDLSLPPMKCAEIPYSFCCMPKETLLPKVVLVKFVDEQGKTILKDARGLLGIKEGATVVIRGHAKCTEEGDVTAVLANGLYLRGDSYIAPEGLAAAEDAAEALPVFDTGLPLPE
jgi:hypothetical protein